MKATALKKIIPASALALCLMASTSCRIEKFVPELEPYLKELTGSETNSYMSALTAITSGGSSTEEFKSGFKAGYETGLSEAASKSVKSRVSTSNDFNEGYRAGYSAGFTEGAKLNGGQMARNTSQAPVKTEKYSPPASIKTSAPVSVAAVTSSAPSEIPSWGYTSNIGATSPTPEISTDYKRPTASSKSPSKSSSKPSTRSYTSSRSRGCAGGS